MIKNPRIILLNPITLTKERVLRVERCQQKKIFSVGSWPPISLLEIESHLAHNGFSNTCIIDGEVLGKSFSQLIESLIRQRPDVIIMQTSLPTSYDDTCMAQRLKKSVPHVVMIAIGVHATLDAVGILSSLVFDYCIQGEAERTVSLLLNSLIKQQSLVNFPNIAYRDDKHICVAPRTFFSDAFDYPRTLNRALIDNMSYTMPLWPEPFTIIKVSKGCDYACSFCTSRSYYGRGWVARSINSIIEEIRDCYYTYSLRRFLFLSDTFNAQRSFVIDLCKAIIELKVPIQWISNCRIDQLDAELCDYMFKAGCILVSIGIESFDEHVQTVNNKNIDIACICNNISLLNTKGIMTYGYFIIGLYGDTILKTLHTIHKARTSDLTFVRFYSVTPYPGTDYFEKYKTTNLKQYYHGSSTIVTHGLFNPVVVFLLKCVGYIWFYSSVRRVRAFGFFKRRGRK